MPGQQFKLFSQMVVGHGDLPKKQIQEKGYQFAPATKNE